jgi:hypothetical protein
VGEATPVDGEPFVAGDDTAVSACKRRVVQALTEAGIHPSLVTGLALLDTAVTLLTFHDITADAIDERVRRCIVDAEDLKITTAFPDARLRAQ